MSKLKVQMKQNFNLQKFIRPALRKLKAYQSSIPDCRIRLDANESPFPIPSKVKKLIIKEASSLSFNRYPDPLATELRRTIATRLNIPQNCILLGNGSDEIISYIISAFGKPGEKVLFPIPTFAMYRIISISHGQKPVELPLNRDFDIDLKAFRKKLETKGINIIFISYPNNPTGKCFSSDAILNILKNSNSIVVIDEAYFDFSGKTFLRYIKKIRNLIVLRTLSKIGMSSLRIGIAAADKEIISILEKVRLPYNLNSFSQAAAKIFLENFHLLKEQINTIKQERSFLISEMNRISGITPYPSDANFILFRTQIDHAEVYKDLLKAGIAIRCFGENPLLKNFLRVTIGTPKENREFLKALKRITTQNQ